jgi:hypothetical protein
LNRRPGRYRKSPGTGLDHIARMKRRLHPL